MRVVLAVSDDEHVDWLCGVLSSAGMSVAVLSDPTPTSPELRGADLLIVDRNAAEILAGAGPERRVLIAPRDGTVDLGDVGAGFKDVIPIPAEEEDVVARVRFAMNAS